MIEDPNLVAGTPSTDFGSQPNLTPDSSTYVNRPSEIRRFTKFILVTRGFGVGLAIVVASVVLMIVGFAIAPTDPLAEDFSAILAPPSWDHWFGTDQNGRDVFSRVIAAPRVDIYIALMSTAAALVIGVPLGVMAIGTSRLGSAFSEFMLRLLDVIQAFPVFILALALVAAFGPSALNVIIALTVLQFPVFLRLTRSSALVNRNRSFVEAARISGAGSFTVLRRHILPNSMAPAFVGASVAVAQAVLVTAGLSFVGAGIRPPTPEWGAMISEGAQNLITGQWWTSVFPGLALAIVALGYALVGDGLKQYLDPARRR